MELGRCLKTTNAIENLNGQLTKYIGRVMRWMSSDQRQRYIAMALLEVEQRMRRVDGHEYLSQLRKALLNHIHQTMKSKATEETPAAENFN